MRSKCDEVSHLRPTVLLAPAPCADCSRSPSPRPMSVLCVRASLYVMSSLSRTLFCTLMSPLLYHVAFLLHFSYPVLSLCTALYLPLLPKFLINFSLNSLMWYLTGSFSLIQYFTANFGWSQVTSVDSRARRALHQHGVITSIATRADSSQALLINLCLCRRIGSIDLERFEIFQ